MSNAGVFRPGKRGLSSQVFLVTNAGPTPVNINATIYAVRMDIYGSGGVGPAQLVVCENPSNPIDEGTFSLSTAAPEVRFPSPVRSAGPYSLTAFPVGFGGGVKVTFYLIERGNDDE